VFDIVPTADAVEVNLRDCSAVTFVCVGADTYTVQIALLHDLAIPRDAPRLPAPAV
jgi:hypothetical protein